MKDKITNIINKPAFYPAITIFALLFQWVIIAITSVNVPQGDEWENLVEHGLPQGFSWKYLFAFHNEHRVVFTKLFNYIFLVTSDWNLKYQIIANYLVWSAVVLFLLYVQKNIFQMQLRDFGFWFFSWRRPSSLTTTTGVSKSVFIFSLIWIVICFCVKSPSNASTPKTDGSRMGHPTSLSSGASFT
ncbi:MAG: hypothetical protein IPK04_13365 [Bdellovibrionales bacterium]|nr:hypothetical protein [Bdellovibrionales bacterium]